MTVVTRLHHHLVLNRRVRRLVEHLLPQLPPTSRVLDIGAGDGRLAAALMARSPTLSVEGVDVLVRPCAAIPIAQFDGLHLPQADRSVDYALLIDVLHHAKEPAVLLREALRVSRVGVLLKDHVAERRWDHWTLRLMDWVGNAGHGVSLPYRYLSRGQWGALFTRLGADVTTWNGQLALYPIPASSVLDRGLHFVALVRLTDPTRQWTNQSAHASQDS